MYVLSQLQRLHFTCDLSNNLFLVGYTLLWKGGFIITTSPLCKCPIVVSQHPVGCQASYACAVYVMTHSLVEITPDRLFSFHCDGRHSGAWVRLVGLFQCSQVLWSMETCSIFKSHHRELDLIYLTLCYV